MPDTPPLIHYLPNGPTLTSACGDKAPDNGSPELGKVTCFACRNSRPFHLAIRGVGTPTPLPQRVAPPPLTAPVKLSGIMADDPYLRELADKARARTWDLHSAKNQRGNYVIEEVIHHGEYRHTRRVEVYDINETTVDGVLMSSAYCYGSWADPHGQHATHRRAALLQLVNDLRSDVTNRAIGWSTFRLITNHTTP